ncbi:YcaO-like family protein [Cyclobacterium sp.]|uniref:YcaO-like family protein n=1 Tax=Cyclobacterium sp. TaxID=1966343 RepID=UPI0019B93FA4|nr:YcaO-like family protein [Cyclobacterium sp.]MBD3628756.1 YcaO-like family protein [Cyclobacterium sp.]
MNDLITPIRRLTDTLPFLLDPKVGIITGVREHPLEVDSPRFFRFNGSAANTEAFGAYRNFAIGGGAAINRELALAKTIGECVERYCAAIYDKKQFPLCSYNKAPFTCVHPKKFALYSQEQYNHPEFEFDEFTEDAPVRWIEAINLETKERTAVPASMVFVPYFFYENGDETPIVQPISSGLSCHCSLEEAVVGGICEVIERDNFMITWQAKLSRRKIRKHTLSKNNQDLIQRFEEVGYEIHLMDISNETKITGILAVATGTKTNFVPLVVAASVALSPEEAVRKAIEELAHTERYAYQIKNELPRLESDPEFDNVLGQVHHVNFWVNSAVSKEAEFLYSSDQWMDFKELVDYSQETPSEDMKALVALIKKSGYDVLVTDITTSDIRSLGMTVIRAIIPGYHPLFMGYHKRPLGGDRLWTIPQQLGFEGLVPGKADYPFPHPFP